MHPSCSCAPLMLAFSLHRCLAPASFALAAGLSCFFVTCAGLTETIAFSGAMVFDLLLGRWLKTGPGWSTALNFLVICAVGAVICTAAFMQLEVQHEGSLATS